VYPVASVCNVKVRIRRTPGQEEIDGVRLDDMKPGSVREVSPSIGSWLIAERYAEPEMRASVRTHDDDFLVGRESDPDRSIFASRRRRSDW
jgi:hypothetical protein